MPNVRKLTAEEIAVVERGKISQRAQIEAEYDQMVAEFNPSDWAELELSPEDTKPTVRNRVNAAFARRGLDVKWLRGGADTLKFRVLGTPVDATPIEDRQDDYDLNAESFELPALNGGPTPLEQYIDDQPQLQERAVGSDVAPSEQAPSEQIDTDTERMIKAAREAAAKNKKPAAKRGTRAAKTA